MPVRGAEDEAKSPPIAGTYAGVVHGDKATAILKVDGSMVVRPNDENRNFALLGTWKREGNNIIAKLEPVTLQHNGRQCCLPVTVGG